MAWTDESHLLWHALPVAPITVARRDLSPLTGTVSQPEVTYGKWSVQASKHTSQACPNEIEVICTPLFEE